MTITPEFEHFAAKDITELCGICPRWLCANTALLPHLANNIAPEARKLQIYRLQVAMSRDQERWLRGGAHPAGTRARAENDALRAAQDCARAILVGILGSLDAAAQSRGRLALATGAGVSAADLSAIGGCGYSRTMCSRNGSPYEEPGRDGLIVAGAARAWLRFIGVAA